MRAASSGGTYELRRVKEDKYVGGYFEKNLGDHTRTHISLGSTKIATVNNSDDPYFILGDHLGSSSILTDNSGDLAEVTDYEPYGKIAYEDITTDLDNEYKHTGKEVDEETTLQYSLNRYYDNELGRFISVDPLLIRAPITVIYDPQSLNSYSYVLNNPIIFVDPDGKDAKEFGWGSLQGVWEGLKETGQGIAATAKDPSIIVTSVKEVAQEIYNDTKELASDFTEDSGRTVEEIRVAFEDAGNRWDNLSDEEKGRITGYALEKSAEAYFSVKAIKKGLNVRPSSTAQKIANGHAYNKHVIQRGEFSGMATNRSSFASHIDDVMNNPTAVRQLERGRTAYWHENSNTIVIKDPNHIDGGTAFQPNVNRHGYSSNYDYFTKELK